MKVAELRGEKCVDVLEAVEYMMMELARGESLKILLERKDLALDVADLAYSRGYRVEGSGEESGKYFIILKKV